MHQYHVETPYEFEVAESRAVYEIQLQTAWSKIGRSRTYETADGQPLQILSPGTWNLEAGPDFKNAKIKLGEQILTGDVEVHCCNNDWYAHNHHLDSGYDQVILHVIAELKHEDGGRCLPELPTFVLAPRKQKVVLADAQKISNGLCASMFAGQDDDDIFSFLVAAGEKRFKQKVEQIVVDMLKFGADGVLLRMLFEALGYKENRDNFLELFKRLTDYSNDCLKDSFEVILWGESGMIPDPAAHQIGHELHDFVSHCWKSWWLVRQTANPEIKWHRSSVRPLNSPERRLAALTLLLKKLTLSPMQTINRLAESCQGNPRVFWDKAKLLLVTKHSIWDKYTNFFDMRKNPAAVLGTQRALDICVNVVLPCLAASARISQQQNLANFAESAWLSLPKTQDNRILKNAALRWFMPPERGTHIIKNAAAAQGVLFVYKNFCERNQTDCPCCELFNLET